MWPWRLQIAGATAHQRVPCSNLLGSSRRALCSQSVLLTALSKKHRSEEEMMQHAQDVDREVSAMDVEEATGTGKKEAAGTGKVRIPSERCLWCFLCCTSFGD